MNNLHVVKHPLLEQALTCLRDSRSSLSDFRSAAESAATILLVEAFRELPLAKRAVQTPLAEFQGVECIGQIVLVPILRAGLALLPVAQSLVPQAQVGFFGLRRDENTSVASSYYCNVPSLRPEAEIFILDPMLATGGSAALAAEELLKCGGTKLTLVSVISAPEGIAFLQNSCPRLQIVTAAVDQCLNERKFIVPGLGDYGDRYFGT